MSRAAPEWTPETPAPTDTPSTPGTARSRMWTFVRRLDGVLAVAIAAAAALRFWRLSAQSLWYDEWLTSSAVSGGVRQILRHVEKREGIAPTYFLLMHGWVRLFGAGETALRSVSALAGTATVAVAYAIARELGLRRATARVAAFLVAVSPMLVWYSQEARPYSIVAFLGALSFLTFVRVRNRGRRQDFLVWALVCACTVAFHYFAAFIVATEAMALLLSRRDQWREVLLSCVPGAVVLSALAPVAAIQYSHTENRQWISGFGLRYRLSEAGRSALVGPSPPSGRLWIAAAMIAALAALLIVTRTSHAERRAAALTIAVAGGAVVLPLGAVVIGVDVVLARYLIASLVPLVVAASIGLATHRARWIGGAAAVVLCAISLTVVVAVARDPRLQKPDWRAVARVFETGASGRVLLMNASGGLGSPLLTYVHDVRALGDTESARIEEIDVLVLKPTKKPCNLLVGTACGMVFLGAPLPTPITDGFHLEKRYQLPQFTVDRYRAVTPRPVTKAQLVAPQDLPGALALVSTTRG